MTVYADKLRDWGWRLGPSCHLLPNDLEEASLIELHEMADRLGLKRSWFQHDKWPHYDLTAARRARALSFGCQEIRTADWIRRQRHLTGNG